MGIEGSKDTKLPMQEKDFVEQKIYESTEETIKMTSENLKNLKSEILWDTIEDFSSRSLESLYNELNILKREIRQAWDSGDRADILNNNIIELELYLNNMNPDENERIEIQEKINKYKNELDTLKNELKDKKENLKAIKREIEKRLENEKDSGELYAWFLKIFNLWLPNENWQNNKLENGIIINSTVIEKDGKEIWKEIEIIKEYWKEYIFRDSDGNYSEKHGESNQYKNISQKDACITLSLLTNNSVKSYDNKQEIDYESYIKNELIEKSDSLWIKEEIVFEYLNFIRRFGKIEESLNDNQKISLWLHKVESKTIRLWHELWCLMFCIQKLCPIHYEKFQQLLINIITNDDTIIYQYGILKKFIISIESYWDSAYEYLNFCSAFEGSYTKNWVSNMHNKFFWETLEEMKQRKTEETYRKLQDLTYSDKHEENIDETIFKTQHTLEGVSTFVQYFENFAIEPESVNLFSFLKENPQTLDNLWWKEINTINLSLDSWINFAFRGIIEMVKSRPDIDFPHLKENASEEDKQQRNQQREKIIKEYENMLRNYIAKDKQENSEGHEKTFDKIFFTLSQWDIWLSNNKDANYMPSKSWAQQFSSNDVVDYSNIEDEYVNEDKSGEIKLISDVEKYVQQYPDAKILICINQHGYLDWSSGNWWSKEDRERLANLSPNIKIWSIRCYFWAAYNNKDIYDYQASVSWFSNNTPTLVTVCEIISDASSKNLWFHEMEIYTRLNYPVTVAPLTESMEYIDWNTWEKKIWKIWLAQNNNWENTDFNNHA